MHPNVEHVLVLGENNQDAINSIANFIKVVLRRIKVTQGLSDQDRIQLFMNTQKKPIKTSVLKIRDLINNLQEEFLDKIEEVLQSQDELTFDGNTVIEVLMIEMPQGAGRLYALSKEEWNLKKCLVLINNDDGLCAARAIAVCLSYLRDGPTSSRYKNMKHGGRKEQYETALDLHQRAHVPIGEQGVGLDDMEKLAKAASCELNIICWENNNQIMHTCNHEAEDKVYLHKHGNHYNAITKVHAFYNKQKYCHKCKVGYDKEQDHRCSYTCSLCLSDCAHAPSEPYACSLCYRTFKSKLCYENHLKTVCKK